VLYTELQEQLRVLRHFVARQSLAGTGKLWLLLNEPDLYDEMSEAAAEALGFPVKAVRMLRSPELTPSEVLRYTFEFSRQDILVSTGSYANPWESVAWMEHVRFLMLHAHRMGMLAIGSCAGFQLGAQAAGGTVGIGTHGIEVGAVRVVRTPLAHWFVEELEPTFWGVELHSGALLSLPHAFQNLAVSEYYPQVVAQGDTVLTQFHWIDFTVDSARSLLESQAGAAWMTASGLSESLIREVIGLYVQNLSDLVVTRERCSYAVLKQYVQKLGTSAASEGERIPLTISDDKSAR